MAPAPVGTPPNVGTPLISRNHQGSDVDLSVLPYCWGGGPMVRVYFGRPAGEYFASRSYGMCALCCCGVRSNERVPLA